MKKTDKKTAGKADKKVGQKAPNEIDHLNAATMLEQEMGMALDAIKDLQGKLDDSFSMQ